MDAKEIGKNIKRLRKSLGLTQAALAQKLGVTYQAVSRWENGKNTPDLQVLLKIKDLFNLTVDEVLLQEKPFETVYKEKEWYIRFLLYPILLFPLSFLFVQYYLFMYPLSNMVVPALFLVFILIIVMIFVRTKHRGRFYLYFTGGLLLVTIIIRAVFVNYFEINEVPEYKEVQQIESVFESQNTRAEFVRINNDDYNIAIVYNPNYPNFYIYDFSKPFEEMEQFFSSNNHVINEVEVINNTIYFSSYEPYDFIFNGTYDLYKFSLDDYVIENIYSDNQPYGIFTDGHTLNLYNIRTTNYDNPSSIYSLQNGELTLEKEYSFVIKDAKFSQLYYVYSVEIPSNQYLSNIYIANENYDIIDIIFDDNIGDSIDFRQDEHMILTSIDGEIIRIFDNEIRPTGYMSYDVKGITLIGYGEYLDTGSIRNWDMELLNDATFYEKNWRKGELPVLIDREFGNFLIGISEEGILYHIEHYSQQVSSILLPPKLRLVLFFASIPFITAITTSGLVEVKEKK
jgi:transcriptional regulator with XRE-family HTH domain